MAARSDTEGWARIKRELKLQATVLFSLVAFMWAIEIVDLLVFGGALDGWGVRPRSVVGLRGILFAPFLHGGFAHLIANTGPLLILGWLVMWRETHHFFLVAAIGSLVGGLGIWLIGASASVHIGASIIVFALLGHLLLRGWFDRRLLPILGSVAVAVLYGGMLFGLFPGQTGISWEGHLFGFAGGGLAARLLNAPTAQRRPG
jgi:membrane associated rhomboid family serine protease